MAVKPPRDGMGSYGTGFFPALTWNTECTDTMGFPRGVQTKRAIEQMATQRDSHTLLQPASEP